MFLSHVSRHNLLCEFGVKSLCQEISNRITQTLSLGIFNSQLNALGRRVGIGDNMRDNFVSQIFPTIWRFAGAPPCAAGPGLLSEWGWLAGVEASAGTAAVAASDIGQC